MAQEFYIRSPESEDARGPLSFEQLASLAEAGQVDGETLYFDEEEEEWVPISHRRELSSRLFPEKKKLTVRARGREDVKSLNTREEEKQTKSISVSGMLDEAEGATAETRHIRNRMESAAKAAALSTPALGVIMLLNGLSQVYPAWTIIHEAVVVNNNPLLLLYSPLALLGFFDLLMAVFVFLGHTEVYSLLRLRAGFGIGYFCFLYWAQYTTGDIVSAYMLGCVAASSLAIFVCSMTRRFALMAFFSLLGILGIGGYGLLALDLKLNLPLPGLEQPVEDEKQAKR